MSADVATTYALAELERLHGVEQAARVLTAKVAEHRRRGYDHIRVGACQPLLDALTGTTPSPVDLDEPEPRHLHDEDRCQLWLTEDPDAVCTCRPEGQEAS